MTKKIERQVRRVKRRLLGKVRQAGVVRGHFRIAHRTDGLPCSVWVAPYRKGPR